MLRTDILKCEIHDEKYNDKLSAIVEVLDSHCCTITLIDKAHDKTSWADLSKAILKCIEKMTCE